MEVLLDFFEEEEKLDKLENFVGKNGADFYGLPLNVGSITYEKTSHEIPEIFHNSFVPFLAGGTLNWKRNP